MLEWATGENKDEAALVIISFKSINDVVIEVIDVITLKVLSPRIEDIIATCRGVPPSSAGGEPSVRPGATPTGFAVAAANEEVVIAACRGVPPSSAGGEPSVRPGATPTGFAVAAANEEVVIAACRGVPPSSAGGEPSVRPGATCSATDGDRATVGVTRQQISATNGGRATVDVTRQQIYRTAFVTY